MNIPNGLSWSSLAHCCLFSAWVCCASTPVGDNALKLPAVGDAQVLLLTPTLLEVTFITSKKPDPASVERFHFVDAKGRLRLPEPGEISVSVQAKPATIQQLGFKRRVVYAPLKKRDLRIGNYLYVMLAAPVGDNDTIEVTNPNQKLWPASLALKVKADPLRWSPLIHVNQTGYLPAQSKKAMIGYYAGSLEEVDWFGSKSSSSPSFKLLDTKTGQEVFGGSLKRRRDDGFPSPSYQMVLEADFTKFTTPGEYRLWIGGLGSSYRFFIDEAVAGAFARCYALGLYHQRCGMANELPFTRFVHQACHTGAAEIPDRSSKFENGSADQTFFH